MLLGLSWTAILAKSVPIQKHLAVTLEAVEYRPSPSTIRTDEAIRHVSDAFLE